MYNHYVLHSACTFEVAPVAVAERSEWLDSHARGGRYRLLIASDGEDRALGWATTSVFRPRAAYETTVEASVYCDPGSLGLGIGSSLYRALFEAIEHEDIERVVAGVTQPNAPSIALHERFGFRVVGTFSSVGRKFGRYWDVTWLERPRSLPEGRPTGEGRTPLPSIAEPPLRLREAPEPLRGGLTGPRGRVREGKRAKPSISA